MNWSRNTKCTLTAIALGLAGLLVTSCSGKKGGAGSAAAAAAPPPEVVVAQVVQQDVAIYSEFVGQTRAVETVDIRARVQGVLEKIYFAEGSPVRKGEVLFQIQKSEYEAKVIEAKSAVARAESDLQQATQRSDVILAEAGLAQAKSLHSKAMSDLRRYIPLARENAVTQIDLDAARAAEETARAEVVANEANLRNKTDSVRFIIARTQAALLAAKANLTQAILELSYCTITSPISGMIGLQEVNVGNLVGKNEATLLATVSSASPIFVDFSIGEAFYLQLTKSGRTGSRAGVDFSLILSDNSVFNQLGRFSVVDRAVDTKTGTIKVRASFLNPEGRLRPGQFARIRVAADERPNVILVPQTAVQELQSARYVLIVDGENKVQQRTVTIGDRYENSFIVLDGLKAGERVVTEGVQKVKPGMVVKPSSTAGGS